MAAATEKIQSKCWVSLGCRLNKQTPDAGWTMAFSASPVTWWRDTGHNLNTSLHFPKNQLGSSELRFLT